jgi:hypothetical protein
LDAKNCGVVTADEGSEMEDRGATLLDVKTGEPGGDTEAIANELREADRGKDPDLLRDVAEGSCVLSTVLLMPSFVGV